MLLRKRDNKMANEIATFILFYSASTLLASDLDCSLFTVPCEAFSALITCWFSCCLLFFAVPMVLKCCAEFIEEYGIVDGIYRLSGITSNIQKLR